MIKKSDIESFAAAHTEEAIALLEELGAIPAPSHHEELRAEFCRAWFERAGVENARIDKAKNVICRFNCDGCEDITVFMAHTDVVFDDRDPFTPVRDGSILHAPGIGDDTANLVNLMMGTRFLLEHRDQLHGGIMIVANSCEEGLGNLDGCREIFKTFGDRIRRFYSFDGYEAEITSEPVGSHRYRMVIRAEGGHSFGDFGMPSAIAQAAELVCRLYAIELPDEAKTTCNVGRIEGGTTVNSIAERCELLYEYRSSSASCLKQMRAAMRRVIDGIRAEGVDVEIELVGERPGAGNVDPAALRAWTDANIETMRPWVARDIEECAASTDANIPLSLGVLANTIGTIEGDLAHTREEWVDLTSIPRGIGLVCSLIARYLG
ncbi:peptidase M20 [Coriobacterium glomerans PW2]|uniref:Peptidase M20 n=1 Tax=Coriobacterium glomerans (strain ATCC 49209 / DSM 20642 / JCM 10262 / PW2) TaxID=700015 RepID=F2N7U6_CORGP|nr:M20/M25/M40 family metallo-hydrolase [Coriobacterium glomerans]AEB07055.1 peptidase M20 [Coriobacterium glomerans PW2]